MAEPHLGQNAAGRASDLLVELQLRLKHTFGPMLVYAGTTTDTSVGAVLGGDIDLILIFSSTSEVILYYCQRIVSALRFKYNIVPHTRVYSYSQALNGEGHISLLNKVLLRVFLRDIIGTNPFMDVTPTTADLNASCKTCIEDALKKVVALLPLVYWETDQVKQIGQAVFDAVRAYLVFAGKPLAGKSEACSSFVESYPGFLELNDILSVYRDPAGVPPLPDLAIDAYAIVRHLLYRIDQKELTHKITLVNTPSSWLPHPRDDYLRRDLNMPLGLLCVATYCRERGLDANILDAYAENLGALSVVERLFDGSDVSSIIGFNCSSPNAHVVHRIARYVKRIDPRVRIVVGGAHATLAPSHLLSTGTVDYVVVGEGEATFYELAKALTDTPGDNVEIVGVFRQVAGRTVGRRREDRLDLATLPPPDFSLLPVDRYFEVRRRLYLHSTRGCPHACVFCSVPQCWDRHITESPVLHLVDQIASSSKEFGAMEFQIVDDNFSLHSGARIREFCDALLERDLPIRWKCQARADQLSDELVSLMAKAGAFEIDLGIESGSPRLQALIHKRLDLEKVPSTVESIARAGIVCKAFFMIGFPDETADEIAETINYAVGLRDKGLRDVAFFPVMPFPGTELAISSGVQVLQGAVVDSADVFDMSFAGSRLRKYSAKPEVSLNRLFSPDDLRLLVRFAYQTFSVGGQVKDLSSEFGLYKELEEDAQFGA